jgi:hypothetical protein
MLKINKQFIAALILAIFSISASAQTIPSAQASATVATSDAAEKSKTPQNASFDDAVATLEKDIIVAMDAFAKAGVPDATRVKEFDDQMNSIDKALAVTADGGEMDLRITAALALQNKRLRRYEALSIDQKLSADQRSQYEDFVKKGKKTSNSILSNKTTLRRLRSNLEDSRTSVDANKQFYIDAVAEKELELASKALTSVNKSMLELTQMINAMKETNANLNNLPQQ